MFYKLPKRLFVSVLIIIGIGIFGNDLLAQKQTRDSLALKDDVEKESNDFFGPIGETKPIYKNGGYDGLRDFLAKTIKYQNDSVQGTVYVQFTIDTSGNTKDIKILRGLSKEADNEVLRVVDLLEFIPGTLRGEKVSVRYNLPVTFSLGNDKRN